MSKIYSTSACGIAQKWNDVSDAVANKESCPSGFNRFYMGKKAAENTPTYGKIVRKNFILSAPLEGISLTGRETEVMYWVCQGETNKQIGARLSLSPRTTEYYVKNVRTKTAANTKSHLVRQILRTDFLERIIDLNLIDLS